MAAFCFLMLVSSQAVGAPIRVYDAGLSLRGNCSVSAVDPVPDPGCPGGSHPPKPFFNVCGAATDPYGDIYVASSTVGSGEAGRKGRINVFNSKGEYLAEIEEDFRPCDLAVDSKGNLYVLEHMPHESEPGVVGERVMLFTPASFPPQPGTPYPPQADAVVVYENPQSRPIAIAVDPSNDHLYLRTSFNGILEYDSADANLPGGDWEPLKEGVGNDIAGVVLQGGLDISGATQEIYSPGVKELGGPEEIYVFDSATDEAICSTDGSETPAQKFSFINGNAAIAVDQSDGSFYVDDTHVNKVIDHFDDECKFIDQLPNHPPELQQPDFRAGLAVNAPCIAGGGSCDVGGYHSPIDAQGSIYVGSGESEGDSHLFAFPLKEPGPPEIQGQVISDISDTEAIFRASVNPHALETHYHFDFISQADFEANGDEFGVGTRSTPAPDARAGNGASFVAVAAAVAGLIPGTTYHVRLVASNCEDPNAIAGDCLTEGSGDPGGEGTDAVFTTYLPASGGLPDQRGYELVTPPETGGYVPTMNELGFSNIGSGAAFLTDFAAPGGERLLFGIEGGSLPGLAGGGFHDTYEAHRESVGGYGRWETTFNGISGDEVREPTPNGFSADHNFSFWAVVEGAVAEQGNYILRSGGILDPACAPQAAGRLELIGCGSLGTDPYASGGWISLGAGHVIFSTLNQVARDAQRLEPQAPPTSTGAVYDRTPDGVTHVVSLKPDGGSFEAGESARYLGASTDGTAVAFEVGDTLYVRLDNEETVKVAEGGQKFGGLSQDGSEVVYLKPDPTEPALDGSIIPQGEIFVCKVREDSCGSTTQVGSGPQSVLVNVSPEGSRIYFAEDGDLFLWDESGTQLIAELDLSDIIGHQGHGERLAGGLGLWVPYVVAPNPEPWQGPASDPSRTTVDGSVFVFESRSNLSDYDSDGHSEVYRYDVATDALSCLSCNPTGIKASSDAQLESDPPAQFVSLPPVNALSRIANVTSNGKRVFFQSSERLVLGDIDGKLDIYEWQAAGEGGCARQGGCIHLVSSGQSASDDYLYAMTPDGRDVFFETGDQLVPRDKEAAPSIYDAREGGGEAPEAAPSLPCEGEACQSPTGAPAEKAPASSNFEGAGNQPGRRCGRKKHKARAKRGARCAGKTAKKPKHGKKASHRHKHGQAHSKQGAGR